MTDDTLTADQILSIDADDLPSLTEGELESILASHNRLCFGSAEPLEEGACWGDPLNSLIDCSCLSVHVPYEARELQERLVNQARVAQARLRGDSLAWPEEDVPEWGEVE